VIYDVCMRTSGLIKVINGEEVLLGIASSNNEIRWGLYGIEGAYVDWYGYRCFYIIATDTDNVSNIVGKIEVGENQ